MGGALNAWLRYRLGKIAAAGSAKSQGHLVKNYSQDMTRLRFGANRGRPPNIYKHTYISNHKTEPSTNR